MGNSCCCKAAERLETAMDLRDVGGSQDLKGWKLDLRVDGLRAELVMQWAHTSWAPTIYKWTYNPYQWPKING